MIQALPSRLMWAFSAAFCLLLLACGSRNEEAPPLIIQGTRYESTSVVPARFEKVEGTALFEVSPQLASFLAAAEKPPAGSRGFFILLNPRNPIEGILVRAGTAVDFDLLYKQTSRMVTVTGNVQLVAIPQLADFVQDRFGISLARDEKSLLLWIDNETPLEMQAPEPPAQPQTQGAP
ncbi:MAG: hypothetical protein ACOX9B_04315 [Candidatus Xenobium sp.]|jgi:hypothetical protein|nr:hypothetical protein [Burkholderiales bacterium]